MTNRTTPEELVGTVAKAICESQGYFAYTELPDGSYHYTAYESHAKAAIEASGLEQLLNRVERLETELRDLLADPESVSRQADARAALTGEHNG